jgi:glycosyltransferase involved in cell wall biosynthesis
MKIAIIQDELVRKGGAEQVVLSFQTAFPDAPIYTLSYNSETTYPEFKNSNIKTSLLGKYIKDDLNLKRFFFPLGVWAMQNMDVKGYDVVLISTTHCAKYINVDKNTLVITYCHTPFRLVWRPDSYEEISRLGFVTSKLYLFAAKVLKKIDYKSALRTDWFLTNSMEVVPRIQEAYHPKRPITVINPPVKCKNFYVSQTIKDYYLVVSRFEPYKKVDLVIQAFNNMPDKKLIVVGKGSLDQSIRSMAKSNVTIVSGLDASELATMFSECKALIFPQYEDYGITPLEANASGRPVIAYGHGGVLETMIPHINDSSKGTALFFDEQTEASLTEAVMKFESIDFNPVFIRRHAEKFDESVFVKKIQSFVQQKLKTKDNIFELAPLNIKKDAEEKIYV